jgi:hypothetical protein
MKINWDFLGIGASVLCGIHCAILPLLISSLPIFGINIIHHSGFESLMILMALAIGSISLIHGYRKHHSEVFPMILFGIGICLLFARQFWPSFEIWLVSFAVPGIVIAHIANFRLSRTQEKRQLASKIRNNEFPISKT